MDIFVRNLPANATNKQVNTFFAPVFESFGIRDYYCEKYIGKNLANITVLDAGAAQRFLDFYGVPTNAPRGVSPRNGLRWSGKLIWCSQNRQDVSDFSLQAVAFAASEKARKAVHTTEIQKYRQNANITRFAISSVQCGQLDYCGNRLCFTTQFSLVQQGTISLGRKEAVIVLGGEDSKQRRIYLNYADCVSVILGQYEDPALTFSLRNPPKFYEVEGAEDEISNALLAFALNSAPAKRASAKKIRITGIDGSHAKVSGMCLVYRFSLLDHRMISTVRSLLSRNVKAPPQTVMSTPVVYPTQSIVDIYTRLNYYLTDQGYYGRQPFAMLYQLDRLARNGVLPPQKVVDLLPTVARIHATHGLDAVLSALRKFYLRVRFAGPDTDANEVSHSALQVLLEEFASTYDRYKYNPENPYELTKRHTHINLVHKIIVTPCGIYLHGPEPEPTNRVLRRYESYINDFARVVFQDEDGNSVRYDPRANQDIIYHSRFKGVLDGGIIIAGRAFSFLGFSHSSLRSQSCWFMAPIFADGNFKLPSHILKELGDFANIRIPAKCAARIGQNFTDTNATVDMRGINVGHLAMVQSGSYDFSDGVGIISSELLRRVWRVYGQRRLLKPTAVQIRYKGYKGMVSLDSRLRGECLLLRENMKKFEAPSAWMLEVCGAAFKPLPMVLNRQFIKIFEDLGVPDDVFMHLQEKAVEELRQKAAHNINAASFLDQTECTKATRMPSLISHLEQLGLDYRQDAFLYKVVEMLIVTRLREIKYRGRIPVESGVTLYGIMDETGELREGEIFAVTEASPEGGRKVLERDCVVITRSPALHPGDIQIVNAVNVRLDSPLQQLSNVVVFSQHGTRDLPSQLSGGDLDGDLYNILYDPDLVPKEASEPAEYPRVSAQELDRSVTSKDMSDFFVTFMENDQLGMISNLHMQLADQREDGAFHSDCKLLAGLASTAVDFSKTGLPVDMSQLPKHDRFRPDFMAPSPRVVVSELGHLALEEEDEIEEPAFEGLDTERRPIRYYQSKKVLGSLYRAIDEYQFLEKIQRDREQVQSAVVRSTGLIQTILQYVLRQARQYGILYDHHMDLARDIRAGYEESLLNILYCYEPSPHMPVSEHEAFAGTILGRQAGAQGKPLRELSKAMRERFESIVEYTIMRIVKGDEQMQGVGDLDVLYDDSLDREVEALPRALACLSVAIEERGTDDRVLGELESFKYVAAGVCLKELERFRITTLGSYVLPRA